jgi:hypothetical protein
MWTPADPSHICAGYLIDAEDQRRTQPWNLVHQLSGALVGYFSLGLITTAHFDHFDNATALSAWPRSVSISTSRKRRLTSYEHPQARSNSLQIESSPPRLFAFI